MRDAIYFELKKRFKLKFFSIFLTYILLSIKHIEYLIKKINLKNKELICGAMSKEEAEMHIAKCYPNLDSDPEIINLKINPKIKCSVIIPVYNHEDILESTLNSVFDQKCEYNFEVILVDDGSTDAAKQILKKYEKYDNCKIIHQENQGIAVARNTGINNAVGEYIMFMDCDDVIENNMLQKLLKQSELNNDDIVFGGYDLIKEKNHKVISKKAYIYPKSFIKTNTSENDIMIFPGYPWGKIYKRTLFEDIRFLPGYWYEDSIIQFLLYRKCTSYSYVPEVFYHYKWYENNFSKTQNSKANPRGVQRYWMLLQMLKKSKSIGLVEDKTFYITLIRHLGCYYYGNIKDFDNQTKIAMFILACDLVDSYKQENIKMNFIQRELEKALLNKNYNMWELACRYQ